jgi:hypothetical protein
MAKPIPYMLRSFKGTMVSLAVEVDKHWLVVLSNKVSFVHAVVWEREEFEHDYHEARLVSDGIDMVLRQFRGYANSVGMTPEAAVYLPKLIKMSAEEIQNAITTGLATQQRIQKEARIMAQADGNISGKAPRKLGGAAAAAVAKKEQRLAAEAKILAGAVSDDQAKTETPATADATLPKAKPARKKPADKAAPAAKTPKGKKEPEVTKDTPKARDAAKIIKGKARSDAQVSLDGAFDPSKLKNSDGDYKSASAMFKGLLYEGKLSDKDIAKQVDKKFSLGETKSNDYVKWNRGWFRRQGVKIADAK